MKPIRDLSIYFCGSIRGGTQDIDIYGKIISRLTRYGRVLTEHVGNPEYLKKEIHQTDHEIWAQDMTWLSQSQVVIAECTQPSLGVGYELGIAEKLGKPCLILFRGNEAERKGSAMLTGNPFMKVKWYAELEEAYKCIDEFMIESVNTLLN